MIFMILLIAVGAVLTYFGNPYERPVMRNFGILLIVGPAVYLGLTLILG